MISNFEFRISNWKLLPPAGLRWDLVASVANRHPPMARIKRSAAATSRFSHRPALGSHRKPFLLTSLCWLTLQKKSVPYQKKTRVSLLARLWLKYIKPVWQHSCLMEHPRIPRLASTLSSSCKRKPFLLTLAALAYPPKEKVHPSKRKIALTCSKSNGLSRGSRSVLQARFRPNSFSSKSINCAKLVKV